MSAKTRAEQARWYRSIGDSYVRYAEQANNPLAKAANLTEAAKYHSMADRVLGAPVSGEGDR